MIGCTITYRGRILICGKKCTNTGLWMIPLINKTLAPPEIISEIPHGLSSEQVNSIQELATSIAETSTKAKLPQYYHQCLLSPPKATLLQALENQPFTTFPGLDHNLISKHLPPSTATDKGHMKARRKNVRSTRNNQQDIKNAQFV